MISSSKKLPIWKEERAGQRYLEEIKLRKGKCRSIREQSAEIRSSHQLIPTNPDKPER